MPEHRVAVLALDGVLPLDFGIPAQIFRTRAETPYRLAVCGLTPQVAVAGGFSLAVHGTLADVRRAHTVIVPGYLDHARALPEEVLDALRYVHRNGRRVVSICVGAFALGQAGLLDGLTVTTHWQQADELAARYPLSRVDRDVLYVDQGNVLTSAGVAAGIDLSLHIVRADLGAAVANQVARGIVAAPHRDGGQSQFIDAPVGRPGGSLAATRTWALAHLDRPLSVRDLAGQAKVSERTLARRFLAETGVTPLQWLLGSRLGLARELLEDDRLSVEQVALRCGFGSAANLRLHFRRSLATTPTAYRAAFVGDGASRPSLGPPTRPFAR